MVAQMLCVLSLFLLIGIAALAALYNERRSRRGGRVDRIDPEIVREPPRNRIAYFYGEKDPNWKDFPDNAGFREDD